MGKEICQEQELYGIDIVFYVSPNYDPHTKPHRRRGGFTNTVARGNQVKTEWKEQ
jgi:hypothetical protein